MTTYPSASQASTSSRPVAQTEQEVYFTDVSMNSRRLHSSTPPHPAPESEQEIHVNCMTPNERTSPSCTSPCPLTQTKQEQRFTDTIDDLRVSRTSITHLPVVSTEQQSQSAAIQRAQLHDMPSKQLKSGNSVPTTTPSYLYRLIHAVKESQQYRIRGPFDSMHTHPNRQPTNSETGSPPSESNTTKVSSDAIGSHAKKKKDPLTNIIKLDESIKPKHTQPKGISHQPTKLHDSRNNVSFTNAMEDERTVQLEQNRLDEEESIRIHMELEREMEHINQCSTAVEDSTTTLDQDLTSNSDSTS